MAGSFFNEARSEPSSILTSDVKVSCSLNNFFCASSDPESQTTTIYRRRAGGIKESIWSMKGYFPVAFVANDGEHLVTGYSSGSVLTNYRRNPVLISFYEHGRLLNQIRLNDVIRDPSKMPKVEDQYHWGSLLGLNADDHLTIQIYDQSWILFDTKTGQAIK